MPRTTISYLEMLDPSKLNRKAAPEKELRIEEVRAKDYRFNRYLYVLVGTPWNWTDRLKWTDDQWRKFVEDSEFRTWVIYVQGTPAGFFELRKVAADVEIVSFGLAEPWLAQGIGGYFLTQAVEEAWRWGPQRVWLHTNTLDHPYALGNYLSRGFHVFQTDEADQGGKVTLPQP